MNYKIGIYVRVSTEEQAQLKEGSIESQKHRARLFYESKIAHEPNWGKVVEIYSDEGLSAKNTRRPAYQKMMQDIRRKHINIILVTDLSRLSRNIMDFCFLLEELRKYNAKFLSIKEQFDTSTATGEMMVFNMINLAQFERKQTSERVTMNFHARALRGLTNGAPIILGYQRDPSRPGALIINDAEASQVRRIFEIYLEEGSLSRALIKVDEEGIRPKVSQNRRHFKAGRGIWTPATLLGLLRNPSYVGLRAVNSKHKDKDQATLKSYEKFQLVKAAWPALVERVVFDEVQQELDRSRARRALGPKSRNYILTGILKCAECGRSFCGASAHGNSGLHRYYVHKLTTGKVACKIKRIRAGKTEEVILPELGGLLLKLGYFDVAQNNLNTILEKQMDSLKPEDFRVKERLLRIDQEIDHALTLSDQELVSSSMSDVLLKHLQKLKNEKSNLELTLKKIRRQVEASKNLKIDWNNKKTLLSKFQSGWKQLRPFQKNRLLQRVFKEIIVDASGFTLVCWSSHQKVEAHLPSIEVKYEQQGVI
ncbi:recombinase family protein [bacterium]|nr:recombinase family protein [bacterium]